MELIKRLKAGDLLYILSIDRLGRNYEDILSGDTARYAFLGEDNETTPLPKQNQAKMMLSVSIKLKTTKKDRMSIRMIDRKLNK